MENIPFLDIEAVIAARRPQIDSAIARALGGGLFILGPELAEFERKFAAYCGMREAVGVACGLDALTIALRCLGLRPGDEVVVPAHTFVATWLAILHAGGTPVAAEPAEGGYLPDAERIEAVLTKRTRAVLVVHLYGELGDIANIAALCAARHIPLIEDAAQAHGACSANRKAGAFGVMGCFSFYPTKNLGALGDGGAIVTDDPDLAAAARKMRNYGSSQRYVHDADGYNSRLDELQAAILSVGLERLDADNARRRAIAARYHQALSDIGELRAPAMGEPQSHVWHIYAIRARERDALQEWLARHGCQTLIHYPVAAYRHAPCRAWAPAGESAADRLTREVLSLPMGLHMSDDRIDRVCSIIASFYRMRAQGALP